MFRLILCLSLTCVTCAALSAADVELLWDANDETDLSHYIIHRSDLAGFTPSASTMLVSRHAPNGGSEESYLDSGLAEGQVFHYRVLAVDTSGNASDPSAIASITIDLRRLIAVGVRPDSDGLEIEHVDSATRLRNDPAGVDFPPMDSGMGHQFIFVLPEDG